MTKNIATVAGLGFPQAIAKLERLGYQLPHPDSHLVHGFSLGNFVHFPESETPAFLVEGNGVLLWTSVNGSVFVSLVGGIVRIYLDGFTDAEEQTLVTALEQQGVRPTVAHEDISL